MNYNYTACCWFPTSSNINTSITVLTNQVWKLLIALFKVPNTDAFTVPYTLYKKNRFVSAQFCHNIGNIWAGAYQHPKKWLDCTILTRKVPEILLLYGLCVYYVVHICDFGMLRVKIIYRKTTYVKMRLRCSCDNAVPLLGVQSWSPGSTLHPQRCNKLYAPFGAKFAHTFLCTPHRM